MTYKPRLPYTSLLDWRGWRLQTPPLLGQGFSDKESDATRARTDIPLASPSTIILQFLTIYATVHEIDYVTN